MPPMFILDTIFDLFSFKTTFLVGLTQQEFDTLKLTLPELTTKRNFWSAKIQSKAGRLMGWDFLYQDENNALFVEMDKMQLNELVMMRYKCTQKHANCYVNLKTKNCIFENIIRRKLLPLTFLGMLILIQLGNWINFSAVHIYLCLVVTFVLSYIYFQNDAKAKESAILNFFENPNLHPDPIHIPDGGAKNRETEID